MDILTYWAKPQKTYAQEAQEATRELIELTRLPYDTYHTSQPEMQKKIEDLILKGANPNASPFDFQTSRVIGYHPLIFAILRLWDETVTFLLEHGANPNIIAPDNDDKTPLITAVSFKFQSEEDKRAQKNIVRELFKHAANPNLPDNFGKTPLMHAVTAKTDPELIQILLDNGAQPGKGNFFEPDPFIKKIFEPYLKQKLP